MFSSYYFLCQNNGGQSNNKQQKWPQLISAPRVWVDREHLTAILKEARSKVGLEHVVMLKSGNGIPGGSGKSTLARKLASELRAVRTGPHVELDLTLEGREQVRDLATVQREFLSAVYPDRIESYTKITPDELSQQYRALFSVAKNGILLLDNMSPKQNDLRKLIPPSESGWLTIVTTREPLQDLDAYNPMKVEIGELSVWEGSKLLEKYAFENSDRMKEASDQEWIEKLVEVCGGIALAIELAGSLLRTQPKLTMEKLYQKLASKGAHKLADKEKSMSACLKVTYDALGEQERRAMWQACAFPKSFKRELFEHAFALWPKSDDDANGNNTKDDGDDDDDESSDLFSGDDELAAVIDNPLDKLKERSMLQCDPERGRFDVHDVVRSFVASRKRDSDDGSVTACRQRCGLAYAEFVKKVETLYEEKDGHGKALKQAREEAESLEAVMLAAIAHSDEIVLKAICIVFDDCVSNFVGLDVQLAFFEKALGTFNNEEERAAGLNCKLCLAGVLESKGEYQKAETMFREVMEMQEVLLGKEHPSTLTSKGNLAGVLESNGEHGKAETMYREVLEVRERVLGKEHPSTLTSKNNLAGVLTSKGEYDKAATMFREVMEAQERVLGPEHPSTLSSKGNLAGVLAREGEYDKAETMRREVMEVASECWVKSIQAR